MEKCYVSDYFDLYDKAFNAACSDLGVTKIPDWRHKWLFRYLQFNPSRYLLKKIEAGDLPESFKDQIPYLDHVSHVCKVIPIYLYGYQSLDSWWFIDGIRIFNQQEPLNFSPIGIVTPNEDYVRLNEYMELKESFDNYLASVYGDRQGPCGLVIGFNEPKSREQLLDNFEKFVDEFFEFPTMGFSDVGYIFQKNKIQEKTLRDSFRALEARITYPDADLLDVAKIAGTIEGSYVGFGRNVESNQSIRSGISRQIKNAIRISENAARGLFPSDIGDDNIQKKTCGIAEYFDSFYIDDLDYEFTYEQIKNHILVVRSVYKNEF